MTQADELKDAAWQAADAVMSIHWMSVRRIGPYLGKDNSWFDRPDDDNTVCLQPVYSAAVKMSRGYTGRQQVSWREWAERRAHPSAGA